MNGRTWSALLPLTLVGLALSVIPVVTQSPTVADVVQRAGKIVARYAEESAVLMADERCEQKAFAQGQDLGGAPQGMSSGMVMGRLDPKGKRTWRAELAIVRTPELARTGRPWLEIRDVVEADGKAVAGRGGRLSRLLVTGETWAEADAAGIGAESSRIALDTVERILHTPTVALLVVHPAVQSRFGFTKAAEEKVDGVKAWKVDFRELRAPTLLRGDGNAAAQGSLWIEPATGEILRSTIACVAPSGANNVLTVNYRTDPTLKMRLPADMVERPEMDKYFVEGKCTYSNFRRFEAGAKLAPRK